MTVVTPDRAFPDDVVRAAIRERLGDTLFVEAGAGTGKTTNLVARIVELVVGGAELASIAAITFTEAAAAELRDRVRIALEDAATSGRIQPEVAARVDEAMISTLHAFAHRLLAEHPLEAGLPPAIEVLDEIESALELEHGWRAFADELFARPELEPILLRTFALELSVDSLRDLASLLHQQRDRLDLRPVPPDPLAPFDASLVIGALRTAYELASHCTSRDNDKLAAHLITLERCACRLSDASDELELLHLLQVLPRFTSKVGQAGNWECPTSDVHEAAALAETVRCSMLDTIRAELLDRLLAEVGRFVDQAAADRRAEGRLIFHDLLVLARDLLRDRPDVRRAARQRWRHVLIDEFQDTDPLQVQLAVLLASDQPVVDDRDWPELALTPGRLFFVGDPKQSIYRFRRADLALFHRVRDHATAEPLQLTTNRRSVPGILAWVNAVFATLLGDEPTDTQARYESLVAARPALAGAGGPVPVTLLGGPQAERIDRIRAREAPELAATIRRVVLEGWTVSSEDGSGRPARFADIAVLLPTRTGLAHLEEALAAADVPYRVESSTLVWSGQQVRDLLSILRAVDDPVDEVALVAALRAPALACSDDDLLSFRRAGGRWNLLAPLPGELEPDHPVVRGLLRLREVHDQRWWSGVSTLVDHVARSFGFFALAVDQRRPRDHWRRLRFVVEQARAFETTTGPTLRRFLDWADLQATDAARVREPVLREPDDDAVRILTVHGAKGLEFPVTVLAGLNRELRPGGGPVRALWNDEGVLQVRLGKARTTGYEAVSALDRARDLEEQTRLLYVAATRARDHLIVSLHHKERTCCHAAQLLPLCERFPELVRTLDPIAPPTPAGAGATDRSVAPAPDEIAFHEGRQRWERERAELVDRLGRQPVRSATSFNADQIGLADPPDHLEPDGSPGALAADRDGTAVGRAVHAVLEQIDLRTGAGLDVAARAQAAAEGAEVGEVTRLAEAALASEPVRQAVRGRFWREVYVAAPVDGVVIEGFVDLLYESDAGLVVLDYKTDLSVGGSIDVAAARYRLQVAAYALALEVSLGQPVAAAGLLFLSEGGSEHWIVGNLARATAEVRAAR